MVNFEQDSRQRVAAEKALAAVFLCTTVVASTLRYYVRAVMIKSWGWDDTMHLLALTSVTVYFALTIHVCDYTFLHYYKIDYDQLANLVSLIFGTILMYIAVSVFFKIALALFFLRYVMERRKRLFIIGSTVFYTMFGITLFFTTLFECGNPDKFLTAQLTTSRCHTWSYIGPMAYIFSAINTLTDWIFALTPILVIRDHNMPGSAKISACVLLGMGVLGSIGSVCRIPYIRGLNVEEEAWPRATIGILSVIELGLGITASSLATLRPLMNLIVEKAQMRRNRGRTAHSDSAPAVVHSLSRVDETDRINESVDAGVDDFSKDGSTEMHEDKQIVTIVTGTYDLEKAELIDGRHASAT